MHALRSFYCFTLKTLHLNPHRADIALPVVLGFGFISISLPDSMHLMAMIAGTLHILLWYLHE